MSIRTDYSAASTPWLQRQLARKVEVLQRFALNYNKLPADKIVSFSGQAMSEATELGFIISALCDRAYEVQAWYEAHEQEAEAVPEQATIHTLPGSADE